MRDIASGCILAVIMARLALCAQGSVLARTGYREPELYNPMNEKLAKKTVP
jgi:hypothetical protein